MKHRKIFALLTCAALAAAPTLLVGCGNPAAPENTDPYEIPQDYYRTYYEVFVRSFSDGNGDGIGDFRGLIKNLDYLNDGNDSTTEDLGINGLWLMPINASPSYHKYDVSDYYAVDEEYGTMDDFTELVAECEKRGIWVQMDLVLNHTSTEHSWFKQAIAEAKSGVTPESSTYMRRYNFYQSGLEPNTGKAKYAAVSGTNYKYLCNFDGSMPDLNLADEDVRAEIKNIVDFWLEKGVRSFRLDAVPWACAYDTVYNEANEEFWTWFNDYCDQKGAAVFGKEGDEIGRYCYNVGEVWAGKETITSFYKTGMTSFNYSLGGEAVGSGFAGVANERQSAYWLANELESLQKAALELDEKAIMSNFLSNHDNNRSAGFFGYDPVKIKKAAGLYLLAPGNPYIYYGEEIGAAGSGVDQNKRLPFNWGDKDKGLTSAPRGANYSGKQELGTWDDQNTDKNSVLTFYRSAIKIRNRFPEIARGKITAYALDASGALDTQAKITAANADKRLYEVNGANEIIAAYTLDWKDRTLLIVHNAGGKAVTADISAFDGYSVVATLDATGSSKVSLSGGSLSLDGGSVAVLKKA